LVDEVDEVYDVLIFDLVNDLVNDVNGDDVNGDDVNNNDGDDDDDDVKDEVGYNSRRRRIIERNLEAMEDMVA